MSIPVIAFAGGGGFGKTTLVSHLAWMFADRGLRVLAADFDPSANLTASFLVDSHLERLWSTEDTRQTIWGSIEALQKGIGDVVAPHIETVDEHLGLVAGDPLLSLFEGVLSESWPACLDGNERAFQMTSALWRGVQLGAETWQADVVLVDIGSSLGALTRASLIAADFVVFPVAPDLFSLQGLKNFGEFMKLWRREWQARLGKNPVSTLSLPLGRFASIGYMVLRHPSRLDRPILAFEKWNAQIPSVYAQAVLGEEPGKSVTINADQHCIGSLKDYRSLIPMGQEARKPIFQLKPGDGALGAHIGAVQDAYNDFLAIAKTIAKRTHLRLP